MRSTLLGLTLVLCAATATPGADVKKANTGPGETPKAAKGNYVHVVIFTMKKDTPASALADIAKDCHKMLGKIKTVRGVKVGKPAKDATPQYAKKNYDLALVILVDDYAGLKAYLDDPVHVAFVKKYDKYFDMDKLQVFDFIDETKK